MTPAILQLDDVSLRFGELRAVNGVTLGVGRGQILGIMGPNGSGKTTLLNLASGILRPGSGRILFQGHDIGSHALHEIVGMGLARSFQNPRIFGSLDSVQHSVAALRSATESLGMAGILSGFGKRWTDWSGEARAILDRIFGDHIPPGRAAALPYGNRRLLELARCLSTGPVLLLLDEPTSGLNDEEAALLAKLLRKVSREHALSLVIVDHKFGFLSGLCDRMVIMNEGRVIADGTPAEIATHPAVNEIYFGGAME